MQIITNDDATTNDSTHNAISSYLTPPPPPPPLHSSIVASDKDIDGIRREFDGNERGDEIDRVLHDFRDFRTPDIFTESMIDEDYDVGCNEEYIEENPQSPYQQQQLLPQCPYLQPHHSRQYQHPWCPSVQAPQIIVAHPGEYNYQGNDNLHNVDEISLEDIPLPSTKPQVEEKEVAETGRLWENHQRDGKRKSRWSSPVPSPSSPVEDDEEDAINAKSIRKKHVAARRRRLGNSTHLSPIRCPTPEPEDGELYEEETDSITTEGKTESTSTDHLPPPKKKQRSSKTSVHGNEGECDGICLMKKCAMFLHDLTKEINNEPITPVDEVDTDDVIEKIKEMIVMDDKIKSYLEKDYASKYGVGCFPVISKWKKHQSEYIHEVRNGIYNLRYYPYKESIISYLGSLNVVFFCSDMSYIYADLCDNTWMYKIGIVDAKGQVEFLGMIDCIQLNMIIIKYRSHILTM